MRPDITSEIRFFRFFYALVRDTPRQKRKRQEESIPRRNVSSCLFPYRAGKVLRLHFSNGEAAASGLVDTGNGHKGLGIDLCDQIAELV